jgi:hypothetical protein
MVGGSYSPEGTKNTKRNEIVALQAFGGRLITLSQRFSGCVARKSAKAQRKSGCKLNLVLPSLQRETIVAERSLPSLFFVRFVSSW